MWNPFRQVKLEPIIETPPSKVNVKDKHILNAELEKELLKSLIARTEVSMIYERLATSGLAQLRGG